MKSEKLISKYYHALRTLKLNIQKPNEDLDVYKFMRANRLSNTFLSIIKKLEIVKKVYPGKKKSPYFWTGPEVTYKMAELVLSELAAYNDEHRNTKDLDIKKALDNSNHSIGQMKFFSGGGTSKCKNLINNYYYEKKKNVELRNELSKLNDQLEKLKKKPKESYILGENKELDATNVKLSREKNDLIDMISQKDDVIDRYQFEVKTLNKKNENQIESIKILKVENEELKDEISQYKSKCLELLESTAKNITNHSFNEITERNEWLVSTNDKLEREINYLKETFNGVINERNEFLVSIKKEIKSTQKIRYELSLFWGHLKIYFKPKK